MNVNETLKTMFSDLLPVAADTYKGKATEYIVFNYTAIPEDFGDDSDLENLSFDDDDYLGEE